MRTRSQTRNHNRQQQAPPAVVEPFNLVEPFDNPPLVLIADNRTMAELLQAPTEGYEDAIVIPEINANFELKHGLINLVQNKQFFGHDKEDPHHTNPVSSQQDYSTMKFPDIPDTTINLVAREDDVRLGSSRQAKNPSSRTRKSGRAELCNLWRYGCIKDYKKTVKNGQARTRESEEYKKKPKNQSRSQKSQASAKS
ncbi:hypothetical protein Tco_0995967 [Tanacetum coccineum]